MRALIALLAAVVIPHAAAAECTAQSGPGTAALVELYTSEGCDSCPPADAWLRTLKDAGLSVVPLALHVDYWDYIGWKDPYANHAFSARQREMVAVAGGRVVYTPQVMLAGRDYRGWLSRARFAEDVKALAAKPARAAVALALKPGAITASAVVPDAKDRADAVLFIAAWENGLSSRVTAGENRGVTLRHDYVVREWLGPYALDGAGRAEISRALAAHTAQGAAAFVQNRRTGEVLQAASCGG